MFEQRDLGTLKKKSIRMMRSETTQQILTL